MNCVFWFSLQTLSELLIVRKIERDINLNKNKSSCKVPVTKDRFSLKFNFLNRFLKIFKY